MIKAHRTAAALSSVLLFAAPALAGEEHEAANPQRQISALTEMLSAGSIARVEVVWIRPTTVTRIPIDPAQLERVFQIKLSIRDISESSNAPGLVAALKSLVVHPDTGRPDLRWGVVFYQREAGQRVGAIYFDRTGKRGVVDLMPVSFRGTLFQWMLGSFSSCLR